MKIVYRDFGGCLNCTEITDAVSSTKIEIEGCHDIEMPNLNCVDTKDNTVVFVFAGGTTETDVDKMVLALAANDIFYLADSCIPYEVYWNPDHNDNYDMKKFLKLTE